MSGNSNVTVAVGLSGGVDSAMAAWKLKEQGYHVIGLTMSIWDGSVPITGNGARSGCFGPGEAEDLRAAEEVARRLGIEHAVIPLAGEYKRLVLDYFRGEYRAGRTPNPCVRCNQSMKFGFMLESAKKMGLVFDFFATGHYARLAEHPEVNAPLLLQAKDLSKDQSYFLSRLSRDQLSHVIFPLGEFTKKEVKQWARDIGWDDFANKEESQDFMECGDYTVLFSKEDSRPGNFVDAGGRVLGEHKGIVHYTIGQRKGLNIGGQEEPLFVVAIDPSENRVVLGHKKDLYSQRIKASQVNWLICKESPVFSGKLTAKLRLGHQGAMARMESFTEDSLIILFEEPQLSATPGQILVLYYEGGVVASAIIDRN